MQRWQLALLLAATAGLASAATYWVVRPSPPPQAPARAATGKGGLALCRPGASDQRVVPVFTARLDDKGNLPALPPQSDGQVVYLDISADNSAVGCAGAAADKLYSLPHPDAPQDGRGGGTAVNLRGHVQFANGFCRFAGFYMNQEVMGMHQGWVETYFKPVDAFEMIRSDRFCVER